LDGFFGVEATDLFPSEYKQKPWMHKNRTAVGEKIKKEQKLEIRN
jgi:hypothetical protein